MLFCLVCDQAQSFQHPRQVLSFLAISIKGFAVYISAVLQSLHHWYHPVGHWRPQIRACSRISKHWHCIVQESRRQTIIIVVLAETGSPSCLCWQYIHSSTLCCHQQSWSYGKWFACLIQYHGQSQYMVLRASFEGCHKKDTRTVPLFWKSGHVFSVFKMAVQEAETIIGSTVNHPPTQASILDFITKAASLAKVCNVPWSPNPTGAAGRPITTVTHTTWMNLGQATTIPWTLHVDPHSIQLNHVTQQALALNSWANWSSLAISIQDLHTILNRQVLPQEWDLSTMTWPSGPYSSYVKLTYEWVRDHFDATVHLHQTAILVAIILSKISPDVCHNIKPPTVDLPGDTTQLVRDVPWIPTTSQNHKGMTSTYAPFNQKMPFTNPNSWHPTVSCQDAIESLTTYTGWCPEALWSWERGRW